MLKLGKITLLLSMTLLAGSLAAAEVVVSAPPALEDNLLTIDEAVELAMLNNLDLRMANADLDSANAANWSAWTNFLPQVAGSVTYTKYEGFPTSGGSSGGGAPTGPMDIEMESYSTALTVSQPLFNGGAIYWGKVMAGAGAEMAELSQEAARQTAILATRTAFLDLLKAQEFRTVQEKNLESLAEHLSLTESNLAVGLASRADHLRSISEHAEAEKLLITAENSVRLARGALENTLGLDLPDSVEVVPVGEITVSESTLSLEETLALVRRYNPALIAVRKTERLAEASVGLAASAFWPKLNLGGSYGWANGSDLTFSDDNDYWAINVIASFDIFTSTQRVAKMAKARADEHKSLAQIEKTEREMFLGAEASYLQLNTAAKTIEVSEKQLAAAAEGLDLTTNMYEQGLVSNADYLDMNVNYLYAKLGEISARYDYLAARESLASFTGQQRGALHHSIAAEETAD